MSTSCGLVNYWDCAVIDNNGAVGKFASLHYDAAHPMQVAYYDATHGKVKYAIGTSGVGTGCTNTHFNCFAVDTIGTTTLDKNIGISLTLDGQGQPVIAYQDFHEDLAPARLKLARPASAYGELVGNCGEEPPGYMFFYWQCRQLDRGVNTDVYVADYAAVSVSPAGLVTVAYYETDDYYYEGRLKVAQQHFGIYLPLISK